MLSQKQLFLRWLYRQSFATEVIDFQETLISGVAASLELTTIDAETFAEANLRRFWNAVLRQIDLDRLRGLSPSFEIADATAYRLHWVPRKLLGSSGSNLRRLGMRLISRPAILQAIDAIPHREYEALACLMCRFAGGTRVALTPAGNEGGVDFFGIVGLSGRCHLFAGTTGPLRIIGQVKKYAAPVEVGEIRDFITTIDHVRKRHFTVEPHVPAWFRSAPGAIAGWIVAQRGLQKGAESMARDHGIVLADALDLAEIAAQARDLDVGLPPNERAAALSRQVHSFLADNRALAA